MNADLSTTSGRTQQLTFGQRLRRMTKGLTRPRPPQPLGTAPGGTLRERAQSAGRPLRVAVARFDGIGDWVLTIPLLNALLATPDAASVTVVAARPASLLLSHPRVELIQHSAVTTHFTASHPLAKLRALLSDGANQSIAAGRARRGEFDLVVVPRWDTDSGQNARLWAFATGAPVVGHDPSRVPSAPRRERREARWMSLAVRSDERRPHELDRLDALAKALGLSLDLDGFGSAFFSVSRRLSRDKVEIAVHMTAVDQKREWPRSSWKRLIGLILAEYPAAGIVLVGGPADAAIHAEIVSAYEGNVASKASVPLSALPATLATASLFVGNDSGPAHVAASLGIPTVTVSPHPRTGAALHANSPARFAPPGADSHVVQPDRPLRPCSLYCASHDAHCITQIDVESVWQTIRPLLQPR